MSARAPGPLIERLLALVALRLRAGGLEAPVVAQHAGPAEADPAPAIEAVLGDLLARLRAPERQPDDPLLRLVAACGLSALELELLGFALAPHGDERFGTLFGGPRRLSVAEALAFVAGAGDDRLLLRRHLEDGALWQSGLLRSAEAEVFERRLVAHPALVRALQPPAWELAVRCGGARLRLSDAAPAEAAFEGLARQAAELAERCARDRYAALAVEGAGAEQSRALALALARRLGVPLLTLEPDAEALPEAFESAGILSAAWAALPLVVPPPGASLPPLREMPAAALPPLVALGEGQRLVAAGGRPGAVLPVTPRRPTIREREALWWSLLGEARPGKAARPRRAALAEAVGCLALQDSPPEAMARSVEEARAMTRAAARGRRAAPVTAEALQCAFAGVAAPTRTPLGRAHYPQVPWSSLVLDRRTAGQLEEVVRRLRHRARVQEDWGMAAPRGSGIVTLLHGEAGTGKTHAVEAVATRLAMPLIRADLSSIVSKYIGETEKHLAELFDLAEGFRAILFFDEADALFAKRTGVSDSHDRYANLETNYLLQRLEGFERGIVFLATNLKQNMDDAFVRRIGVSVHVPRPTPLEQLALWDLHLPRKARAGDLPLERLVERFDLVGGEIRNCAVTAAFAAAAEGAAISFGHLERAVASELQKLGRPLPPLAVAPDPLQPHPRQQQSTRQA